ncbi:ATP12 family protein [Devosia neptuniae]|jgi:chaperone required for assembly of F1-ATPase|uniref:ATP12 family chaperone protein n=1 Tax=Devosia TaxID=46913 RepID=UPI0022B07E60|nr:ATP12 family protein [Devosia neptuniae]MCZ4345339.1 ATPase [Devosia neptuniae]|tara:strand:- start:10482 stop:11261 length:780 start_codon:yes stop_codon:yes gene_type:complete
MRDQLEDIQKHLDDGYGRAQYLNKVELPKRFYKEVAAGPVDGGFTVTLDGRQVRTPGRKIPVIVPAAPIATAMASEWAAQGEFINPGTMPTVRLINSGVESGEDSVPAFRDEIVKFAGGDLLLYRAESPQGLVNAQEQHWDDALVRLARHFGVSFQPTFGILHQAQPQTTLDRLAEVLANEHLISLTAMVSMTGLTGSGLLTLGYWHKLIDADAVWAAAHVDEDYQITQWGSDEEAADRRAMRRVEFDTAVAVLEAMRA